jgi:hypothetical protein
MGRQIEMGLVWENGTWSTGFFEIPSDTLEGEIEKVAVEKTLEQLGTEVLTVDLVAAFVYNIPEEEE